jgi:hypothetical protein
VRYLLAAAAVLIASPAFAGAECYTPPGSLSGTASWSGSSKIIETYLTTSNGDRYTCGPDTKQNNPSRQAGSKGYFKQTCGPLTIVREVSYRDCTFSERAGVSSGYGRVSDVLGALGAYMCASNSNIISDTRYELRDKDRQIFQLGTEYGIDNGDVDISDTCTSNVKTQFHTKTWTVGSTRKTISLTTVSEWPAKSIKQPSL